jgi:hypothetical protein
MGNALVVEDDWGLKAVVCRKVQKGKGRSGEQQQEGGPEKNQTAGQQDGPGGNRLGCSSKAATPRPPILSLRSQETLQPLPPAGFDNNSYVRIRIEHCNSTSA